MSSVVSRRVGSGLVLTVGLASVASALLVIGSIIGWDPAWRAFGVTPLQPPFFDMRVINDYAACASKGWDAYAPQACNVDNFNIPPTWLWLGRIGVTGAASDWMAVTFIATATVVIILLNQGRAWYHGLVSLGAIISPSVLMGVERGNLDLLILTLVGAAALIYDDSKVRRWCGAILLLSVGIWLKLFPLFCVSLAARFSKRTLLFACLLAASGAIFLIVTLDYVILIRRNVPTTFILSYGYKAIFLGIDHILSEGGLRPLGLAETSVPAITAAAVLICAVSLTISVVRKGYRFCRVHMNVAGTAFLFGAGIYCGTYLLGTNFVYRLMFLLLCVPQLLDWQIGKHCDRAGNCVSELGLFGIVLGVLWSNGNASGHTMFLLLPQVLNWFLFFFFASALVANFLHSVLQIGRIDHDAGRAKNGRRPAF